MSDNRGLGQSEQPGAMASRAEELARRHFMTVEKENAVAGLNASRIERRGIGQRLNVKVFETVTETYTRVRGIGNGGAGNVYEVESSDGRRFALKVLSENSARSSAKVKRFLRETRFEESAREGIVRALDVGFVGSGDTKRPFYVMKLYDGSLRTLMDDVNKDAGSVLLPLYLSLLARLSQFYREGNVHRDVKPENILYDKEEDCLVLADLGIAHLVGDFPGATVQTKPSDRLANYKYAAPEQRDGSGITDERTDIFAYGLMLNELFTGAVPQGTGYRTIGSVSEEYGYLDRVVEKMISQSPSDRYSSLKEVLVDIEALAVEKSNLLKLERAQNAVVSTEDQTRRIVERAWDDGAILFTLDDAPSRDWLLVFRSYPKTWFTTDGFYFDPNQFPVDGDTITVTGIGHDMNRAERVVDDFDELVEWTNVHLKEKLEHDARLAHDEAVRQRKASLESARRDAESRRAFESMLSKRGLEG